MGNFQRGDNKRIGFSGPRGGDRGGSRGGFGGGRGGSRPSFGGDRGGRGGFGGDRGGERRPVTMHSAVCDECKKECEVPFMPTAGKPVLCKECFGGGRSDSPRSSFGGDRDRGSRSTFNGGERREYSDRRPSFNSRPQEDRSSNQDDLKKQLADVSAKLEKLITLVSGAVEKKEKFKPAAKKETLKSVVRKVLKK